MRCAFVNHSLNARVDALPGVARDPFSASPDLLKKFFEAYRAFRVVRELLDVFLEAYTALLVALGVLHRCICSSFCSFSVVTPGSQNHL